MDKKIARIKNFKYALITLFMIAFIGLNTYGVFAASTADSKDYKGISIAFIIIDIVLFFVMYYMIKKYKSLRKDINVEKNLQVLTFGVMLAFTKSLLIILIVICALLFLTICEFAYLIHTSKAELNELKEQARIKSEELNKKLAEGNISYIMTSEGWYDIAMEECTHVQSIGESPLLYLQKELEKEEKAAVRDDQRIEGLKRALEEVKNTFTE